ncbi:MAG TPA: hypothetical protein VMU19_10265 [Bryobacteraceae bacterium]|nr:hypothetical protein [Bryobacteraceae bacterium]
MRTTVPAAALAAIFWFAASATAQGSQDAKSVCGEAGTIAEELTKISGLSLLHPVPCDFISKEKVNEFLKKRLKDGASPEELRAQELVLRKFGFIPKDFDLAKATIDLLTEQAAAYYDYNRRKLFIIESTPSDNQEPVLAHELSHALADQHFHLAKYIRKGNDNDDEANARMAVMEGQATWLMSEYIARRMGRTLKDSPDLVAMMSSPNAGADGQYPVLDRSPLYVRLSLMFPYTKGMLFQNALVQRDGEQAFAQPFLHPPASTQQILHPDAYFNSVQPTKPALPKEALPRGYKGLVSGTMGEDDYAILMEQYAGKSEAAEIAPHWRGSDFEIRENKKAGRDVLFYSVEWDSEEMASRYFDFYKQALRKKWQTMTLTEDTADAAAGTGDDGRFELRRNGAIVTSVEGLPPGK